MEAVSEQSYTVYVAWCTDCEAPMEIESVTDQWLDGKPVSGHFACSRCGKQYGVWMEGGTIDLGLDDASVKA